jgi:hypothetical protein
MILLSKGAPSNRINNRSWFQLNYKEEGSANEMISYVPGKERSIPDVVQILIPVSMLPKLCVRALCARQ